MTHNKKVGRWGEEASTAYLRQQGYEILSRNARTPCGEIDIIARQADITIFIEVKTLTASKSFFPEQNVTARKREHMLACAESYAAEHAIDHWQIDVIAVEGSRDCNRRSRILRMRSPIDLFISMASRLK